MTTASYLNSAPDLRSMLEAVIDKTSEEEETDFKNKIKTYLIESNISEITSKSLRGNFELRNTSDNTLKIIKAIMDDQSYKDFYLDVSDKRFWKIYSLHDSFTTDIFIRNLVEKNFSKLDFLWLPSTLLENYMGLGKDTGFSLKFKNKFGDIDSINKIDDISMRFWGGNTKEIIEGLKANKFIEKGISLSSIGINHLVEGGYAKENVSYFGRFTLMKGNSIDSHFILMEKIKSNYSNLLNLFETRYRFTVEKKNGGLKLSCNPLYIDFGKKIESLEEFVNILFSSQLPFRLSGVVEKENDSLFRIYAIDLHTHDLVNFEVTPEWMSIYLSKTSCGNVITRLVTNMQTYMTSKIKLSGEDDGRII